MEKLLHAYILSGSREATSRKAREMAAEALCEGSGTRPCRNCRHCRKVFHGPFPGIHPDVTAVERGLNSKGTLRQELVVDQIRAVGADAAVLPNEAEGKVYILPEADTLNLSAQNAFLKLLEEPPAYVTFLLCAENPERLLPTVRSRCAELRMGGPAPEADKAVRTRAEAWLESLGDAAGVLRASLALEKLDGAALLEVVRAAMDLAPSRGLAPAELLELEAFLRRAEEYLRANVGVRHVIGYLSTYGYEKN